MWADVLTNPLQGKSYQIKRSNLMNIPEIYVDPGENAPPKVIKTEGVYSNNKHVEFNKDVIMKYIPNITGVQTKIVKLARHAKTPTSSTYVCRSVLAKLQPEKGTDNAIIDITKHATVTKSSM